MTLADATLLTVDALGTFREGFYGESDPAVPRKIAVGIVGIALLWSVIWYWDRTIKRRRAAERAESKTLFADLCAEHGLAPAERKALRSIATSCGAAPPEAVFTRPEILAAAGTAEASKLRDRLFGEPSTSEADPPA